MRTALARLLPPGCSWTSSFAPGRRRFARADAELLLEALEDLLSADERTRHVRAHLDHVPPRRRELP